VKCRHCSATLFHMFIDLGYAPPSNAYLTAEDLLRPEKYYPLRIMVCDICWLVQTKDYSQAEELFSDDYAYFSSTSTTWVEHASKYSAEMTQQLSLNQHSLVIEVASNDGYLLKNFVETGIPCLGIEPTASTAMVAEAKGIPVLRKFFGEQVGIQLANSGKQADLIVGNNVFAHVPDINDFTLGLKAVLKPGGTITMEFPHLMRLIEHTQFDTIYHEHFSYLSLNTVEHIFQNAGLRVWKVEELNTHGGSLRIYGCHTEDERKTTSSLGALLAQELLHGLQDIRTYENFQVKANRVKDDLLAFLIDQKRMGKRVAAYGAAAKGNTLLNYAGIKPDLLSFVCDAATAKQGKFMPGSHIPILAPDTMDDQRPDFIVILPWNIADEVRQQNARFAALGTKFVTCVPKIEVA
jgi:2-polyprenyl-3-methyl-5-hydroxy-6-metoxy-1,4-benzoquinol methylase